MEDYFELLVSTLHVMEQQLNEFYEKYDTVDIT